MSRPRRAARGEHKPLSTHGRVVEAVRVNLLGTFRVSVGGRVVEESAWRLRKAASLVKVLALAPGHWLYTILPEPVKAEYTDIDTTEDAESTTSFDGRMKHPDDPTDLANYFRLDGGILFSTRFVVLHHVRRKL